MTESKSYTAIRQETQNLAESVGQLLSDAVTYAAELVTVVSQDGFKVAADARNMGTAMLEGVLTATEDAIVAITEDPADDSKGSNS